MYDKYPFNFKSISFSLDSAIEQCNDMRESISEIIEKGTPSENISTTDYDMMQQVTNSMELVKNLLEACKLHLNQTSDLLQTL